MAELNLEGLGVALITPFNPDNSIDFSSLEKIVNHTIEGGCDYLVALGTTAETPTLSLLEKEKITRFICEINNNRVPLVVGIGGNNTSAVCHDILSRDLSGYSAILSVAPFYNKPTQEGLYQHFKAISEASPLPVILYNVPGRTGVNLTAITTLKLCALGDVIAGLKDASGNPEQSKEIIEAAPKNFSLFSGNDSDTMELMKQGAKGVISVLANAMPRQMKKLVKLCQERNYVEASAYQKELKPLIGHLFEDGNPAGVKALLSESGLCKNILRLPLMPVSKKVEEHILKEASKFQ